METYPAPIVRPQPLRTSVYQRVVRLLEGGDLVPGATVTEAGLSKALGVSRTPVREALLQLEVEGVLRATPARGFSVRELSAAEAAELFPILATLEGLALRFCGQHNLDSLRKLDAELTAATDATDAVRRWRLDTAFHQEMISSCTNAGLLAMIRRLRVTLSRYEIEYMRQAGGWQHVAGARHAAILCALKAGDLNAGAAAIADNWQDSLDALGTWLE